jgi:hypothetical protein
MIRASRVERRHANRSPSFRRGHMPDDRFEETKLTITSDVTKGVFEGQKPVDIKFNQFGGDPKVPDKQVMVSTGGSASHEVTFPKVKATENHLVFGYTCEFDKNDVGHNDYNVWPKTLEIKATLDNTTKPAERFAFKINQSGKTSQRWTTTNLGTCSPKLEYPADAAIVPVSPWEFVGTVVNTNQPRKRDLKVRKKPWVAKIKNLYEGKKPDKPIKVWVNLAPDPNQLLHGNVLKVEVGPEDLTLGEKDQEIKVRVTFPKENSKCNTPLPALQTGEDVSTAVAAKDVSAKPGENELVYETVVKLPADKQKAVFYVNLGVAGGDKCKIQVGVTDTIEDDVCHTENWRKIGMEMLVPEVALRQNVTDILKGTGAAFADALVTELKRAFDKTFVEFDFLKDGCLTFKEEDLTFFNKGDGVSLTATAITSPGNMFVPADKLWEGTVDNNGQEQRKPLSKGAKAFIPTTHQLKHVRWQKRGQNAAPALANNAMCFHWCDKIADRAENQRQFNPPGDDWVKDMSRCTNFFTTSMGTVASKEISLPFHVFEKDPVSAEDRLGIFKTSWRALRYKKQADPDWTAVGPTTPGAAYQAWSAWVNFADKAAMEKWVEIKDSRHAKVKLRKDDPTDPGNLQKIEVDEPGPNNTTVKVEYLLDIQITFVCFGVEFTTLGAASQGIAYFQTQATTIGMSNTLAHEIGHNFGQAYTEEAPPPVGGRSAGNAIGAIPFGAKTPAGQYYVGKGHVGGHCAKHIVDYAKDKPNKDDILTVAEWKSPPPGLVDDFKEIGKKLGQGCIMYGAGDPHTSDKINFCDECKKYIRATNLSNVIKNWRA